MTTNHTASPRSWTTRLKNGLQPEQLQRHENKVLLALTLVIGAVVGMVVVAFIVLTEGFGSRLYPASGAAWRRVVIPTLGALVTGVLLKRYFPYARGSGIPQTKAALFLREGYIRFSTVLGKFGCSSASLASGIALGREGPAVQIGGGIASVLGRRLGLGPRSVRALVPVGASAALAAAFNTPIAAVLFTLEEVLGDLNAPVLGSIVLSSATSWATLHLLLGDEPLFHVPAYQLVHPLEFAIYAILGVAGGLVSGAFVRLLLGLRRRFLRMPAWSEWLQPAVGGLAVGMMGWFVPEVLGVGYNHVSEALNGQMIFAMMALLLPLKLVATATCYASGNAGGIFGPSLFIGAMLGGAVGSLAHAFLPDYTGSAGAYALVGMGTAFAGIVRAPMTSVMMIFEITRDYTIVVPVMIANLLSYFISERLQREPIYEALLHQDGLHVPRRRGGVETEVVASAMRRPPKALRADALAKDQGGILGTTSADPLDPAPNSWPVLDGSRLLGMVTRNTLERAIQEGDGSRTLGEIVPVGNVAGPLTAETFPHVHMDHPLDTALRRMSGTGLNLLPVVSRSDIRELVGTVSLGDIVNAYRTREREAEAAKPLTPGPPLSAARLLATAVAVLIGLAAIGGVLVHYYRVQQETTVQRLFQAGDDLLQRNLIPEAIEQYRAALSLSHSNRHRLALALALMKAGRLDEAALYLREVLRRDPGSAAASLAMARLGVATNHQQEALEYYRRALSAAWPAGQERERVEAEFELVGYLQKIGASQEALVELRKLAQGASEVGTRRRAGRLLLQFGQPDEAADVFGRLVRQSPQDAEARAGLGEAQFARGDYAAAATALRTAHRLKPDDRAVEARLGLCERILALDPTRPGLDAAERHETGRKILEGALGELAQCTALDRTRPVPASVTALMAAARKTLLSSPRPRSYESATKANLSLAGQMLAARKELCGSASGGDDALSLVLERATRAR